MEGAVALVPKTKPGNSRRGCPVFKMAEIPKNQITEKLHSDYRRRWRKIDPEVMFSIVVYANMRGIFSSRAIEEACKTDIRFMWLLQI